MSTDNDGENDIRNEDVTGNKFSIDYSKRGTAKCRVCKKLISKDDLRIGMSVQYKSSFYIQYRHVQCAFNAFRRARVASNVITTVDNLDGFKDLLPEDMSSIKTLITEENLKRKPLPEKIIRTKKTNKNIDVSTRRRTLIPSNLPVIPVLYTNADQLTPQKMTELQNHIAREKPLIIGICEVKPKNGKDYDQLDYQIPEYVMHPVNLDNSDSEPGGRGMVVYTHKSIEKSVMEITPSVDFQETCLLEIRLRGGDILLFGCLYRSPTSTTTSEENNDNLNKLLKQICEGKYSHICLVGDFNFRDINWKTWTCNGGDASKESKFISTIQSVFLHQHMERPTRRRGNDEPSLLDLLFTDEAMQISEIQHLAPLGKSDHDVIAFKFHSYLDFSKPKIKYLFEKGNYTAMITRLQDQDWKEKYIRNGKEKTVEELWTEMKNTINDLKNDFVPKKKVDGKPKWKEKGSIPISKSLRNAIRDKKTSHRHWSSAKRHGEAVEKRKIYAKANNKVKRLMRKAKRSFERDVALKSKSNPKAFWSFIRSKLKTKKGVGPLLSNPDDKTSTCFEDGEKANILQDQFCSVFTKEPEGMPPFLSRTNKLLVDIIVTELLVKDEIKILNLNKSVGPDKIHPRILFELVEELSEPLAYLFNRTLDEGIIPKDWKETYVSPIFKKGARNRAANYRPISLTSIVCKIMEKIVKQSIMKHLIDNSLLSSKQFGFLTGRSTITQLLKFLDDCAAKIATGGVVDTIYMDFAKAFDKVPHRRLLHKLRSYGIDNNTLGWIKAFLGDRNQTVQVNGEMSKLAGVLSGVPQGSVLGPVLFVIYINDLPEMVKSNVYLFADDTKLSHQVSTAEDAQLLQEDLNALSKWSKDWLLEFNADKCHVITFGRLENIRHTERYKIDGEELEHVFDEKDLGVTMDYELTFAQHISLKAKKANSIMGLIRRSFSFLDKHLFRKLYTTFVRPHLEYAQSVWAPHLMKHINIIEGVQERATRLVDGFQNIEYPERLKMLNLPTMAHRRARGDMIELWKHFNMYDQNTLSESFKPRQRPSRQHGLQLHHNKPNDGVRGIEKNSFYHRVTDVWNKLPRNVVHSLTMDDFKRELDDHWKHEPSKFGYTESSS